MQRSWIVVPTTFVLAVASVLPAAAIESAATAAEVAPEAAQDDGPQTQGRAVDDLEAAEATPIDTAGRTPDALLDKSAERGIYLIRLVDPAVPTYEGGKTGLQRTAPRSGERLDPDSPRSRAYADHLEEEQAEFIDRMERRLDRSVEVPFTYQYAVNGIAAVLTAEEARAIADDPAVLSVAVDKEHELHTDAGPQWLGAEALWDAMTALGLPDDIQGEGIVIGTIDTGISPGNRSFAETGGDGFTHTNPLGAGNFLGVCDPETTIQVFDPNFPCNNKLIGAYVFGSANPTDPDSALDYDGHGSHTASTSGGNVVLGVEVEAPTVTTPPFDISGVAPHANVISYLGCCTTSGLTASINQAIVDGVDVINYSIGSNAPSQLWNDFDTLGFLNARAAGIFVATSNGNNGPGFATTGSPSDAPWILSVGASTHNRHNGNMLTDLTSSEGPLADIVGKSVTSALDISTPLVYAGDVDDPLCEDTEGHEAEFDGNIVICDRGVIGRVQKSFNVAGQGAVGYVLINDEPHGDSLLGDEYAVPGVFISFSDGQVLKDWLAEGTDHEAMIAGTVFTTADEFGDIMASFSSRGPNRAVDVIVPDITAPGVDILAALGADSYTDDIHGFISGTSMSSPHAAGVGALLRQARPEWSPAQAQSALMTTARNTILNHDGEPADPYAQGAGHINVGHAAMAGLLFDETFVNYMAANPAEGGDPKTLNLPSFANSQCLVECSWERTATVPDDADATVPDDVTWSVSTQTDDGLTLDVLLSQMTVSPGDSIDVSVTADVEGAPDDITLFGWITLTPDNEDVPTITMPVAVGPSSGVLPTSVEFETRRNAGSYLIEDIQSIAVSDFTAAVLGMVKATIEEGSLVQDPTRDNPYDDLGQVDVYLVDVPAATHRFVAETIEFEMPDLDLFVGTGDTPSLATEVCSSTSPSSREKCDITDPEPGTWWILIQNWQGTTTEASDAYTLAHVFVPDQDLGNAGVAGPEGPVPVGEPYDVRFHWDIDEMQAGDRWYGTALLGSSPDSALGSSPESLGDIGSFPVTIIRVDDDVTKTASVGEAVPGDTVSYEIAIESNVTPEDLVYTIEDTVPDGFTIDPESVSDDGVVEGQTVTWEIEMPSPFGEVGEYVVSTPDTSAQCAAWSGFLDLADVGIPFAALDGDTTAATAFGAVGPFEHYGQLFPNLVVAEDGLVAVTDGYGGQPWVVQNIPNPALPNGVIAPLWSDLELSLANDRGMRLGQSVGGGFAVIQWDDPFEFTDDDTVGPSVGKFQAWIYNTVEDFRPEMTFEYDTLGALPDLATIGTERILGDLATAALNAGDPSTVLEEGGTFCLDYEGPSFDAVVLEYEVFVTPSVASGMQTNEVVHVTDDPFAQPATTSTDVMVPVCTTPFSDVTGTHPFCWEIAWMVAAGITTGFPDGTFRGSLEITRQAVAAFLARLAEGELEDCTEPPFADVSISHPFCAEIAWMKDAGITTGFPDGTFRPSLEITRQAVAAFLARLAGVDLEPCAEPPFSDVPTTHPFCAEIAWMKAVGITTGFPDGTFRGSLQITRQAVAAFLFRFAHLL